MRNLPHNTRKKRTVMRPSMRRGVRVAGGLYLSASQVRALLDRVNGRWVSLKRAFASNVAETDATRVAFNEQWRAWRAFYADAYDDWLAWSTNVDQAEAFDRERQAFAERYEQITGTRLPDPTTNTTANAPPVLNGVFGRVSPLAIVGGLALVAVAGYAVVKAS